MEEVSTLATLLNNQGLAGGLLVYFIFKDYRFGQKLLGIMDSLKEYLEVNMKREQKIISMNETITDFNRRLSYMEEKVSRNKKGTPTD